MKKIYTLFLFTALTSFAQNAQGSVWLVTVEAFSFNPNNLPNVVCGDTIHWMWQAGTHTTTSTSIPGGAPSWNAPINGSNTTFDYIVPNIAGVYNYVCTPHGFTGSFTVTCGVGIAETLQAAASGIYPNPVSASFILKYDDESEARIINLSGEVVSHHSLPAGKNIIEINLGELPGGIYILRTLKEGSIRQTRKVILAY